MNLKVLNLLNNCKKIIKYIFYNYLIGGVEGYNRWNAYKYGFEEVFFSKPICNLRGLPFIKIGKNTKFGAFSVITAWDFYEKESFSPEIIIGNNCQFGDYIHISSINKIIIEDFVLTGRWVTISDNNHGDGNLSNMNKPPIFRQLVSKGPVIIEKNVWIGDKATILAGVTIGKGSIIGANSVVTKDIPPYSVVGGNPAKIIKSNNNF